MKLHSKICGYYKIERVINAGTVLEYKVPLLDWFPNLITDSGLDKFGYYSGGSQFYDVFCRLGSGSATPDVTDLDLASPLGNSITKMSYLTGNSSSPLYYKWARTVYRFGPGIATGNISEVGVGWGPSSGQLFSRALILDGLGDPTTITKLADETLDVTYEFRINPSLDDFTGGFSLTGNKAASFTYTGRIANAGADIVSYSSSTYPLVLAGISLNAYTGSMGSITGAPTGSNGGASGGTPETYTPGSYKLNVNAMNFALGVGNNALGMKSFLIQCNQQSWQLELNTPIMKTSSDVLTLDVEVSWGRL